jgi:hypothetical protein
VEESRRVLCGFSGIAEGIPIYTANVRLHEHQVAPSKSTHRQCRKLIANGKPNASSTARYSAPMVAPSRQKSLVGT